MSTTNPQEIKRLGCLLTHPLCQQDERACHPTMSQHPHYTLFVFALVHFLIFILVVSFGATSIEYKERYDDKCSADGTTHITFDIKESIPTPIYFYFELDNFYQNHFRFAGSYSFDQLQGKYVNDPLSCQPIREEIEIGSANKKITLAPCGLLSRYMFNDTFTLPETFSEQGIAWPYQVNKSYYLPNNEYKGFSRWMKVQASINPTYYENETLNEHYLTWMHIAPRPHFKKLYAINNRSAIPSGPFTIVINCNYANSIYKYKRYISLMSPGKLGGKNTVLWVLNLVMSILAGIGGSIFILLHRKPKFYYDPLDVILQDLNNSDKQNENDNDTEEIQTQL